MKKLLISAAAIALAGGGYAFAGSTLPAPLSTLLTFDPFLAAADEEVVMVVATDGVRGRPKTGTNTSPFKPGHGPKKTPPGNPNPGPPKPPKGKGEPPDVPPAGKAKGHDKKP